MLPGADVRVDHDADPGGDGHVELADAELCMHRCRPPVKSTVAQVEREVTDRELVRLASTAAVVEGRYVALADAAFERDVDQLNPPTSSTSRTPTTMSPRARPHHALTTSAPPTSASASASTTPRSSVDESGGIEEPRAAGEHEQQAPRDRAELEPRPTRCPAPAPVPVRSARVWSASVRSRSSDVTTGPATVSRSWCRQCRGSATCGGAGSCRASRLRNQSTVPPSAINTRGQNAAAAERPADGAADRHQAERDQAVAEQLARSTGTGRGRRPGSGRHGQQRSTRAVRDHTEPAEERGHDEAEAHQHDVDPEVVGDPARHPAQQAFVGAARQPAWRRRRGGGRGSRLGGIEARRIGRRFDRGCVHGGEHPPPTWRATIGNHPDHDPDPTPTIAGLAPDTRSGCGARSSEAPVRPRRHRLSTAPADRSEEPTCTRPPYARHHPPSADPPVAAQGRRRRGRRSSATTSASSQPGAARVRGAHARRRCRRGALRRRLALPPDRRRRPVRDVARNDFVQVLALGAVTLGVLLLAQSVGLGFSGALLWPIVLAAMGMR